MGYYTGPEKDYTPSMDASRFASAGPSPTTSGGFSEPRGMFTETPGTFATAAGMFTPDGSRQQKDAINDAKRMGMPSVLNPLTPPVKSPLDPLDVGQPFMNRGRWIGGDMRLSPFLESSGFSMLDKLRGGML